MNGLFFGEVATAPDGAGMAQVIIGGVERAVYFNPLRFAAPWPIPAPGDRVAVVYGTPQYHALWVAGAGTATYEYVP